MKVDKSLYSASYEKFVDEVLQKGCNKLVDEMLTKAKKILFKNAVKELEEKAWKKTFPKFFEHLMILKIENKITPTHIFLEYLMPFGFCRCDAIVIAKNNKGDEICIVYEMKTTFFQNRIDKDINQVNRYYNILQQMMVKKTNFYKYLFYNNTDNIIDEVNKDKIEKNDILSNIIKYGENKVHFEEGEEKHFICKDLEKRNFISKAVITKSIYDYLFKGKEENRKEEENKNIIAKISELKLVKFNEIRFSDSFLDKNKSEKSKSEVSKPTMIATDCDKIFIELIKEKDTVIMIPNYSFNSPIKDVQKEESDSDYIGIVWQKDLYFDCEDKKWKFRKDFIIEENLIELSNSNQENELLEILKNRYKELLIRAKKECYIYFHDSGTKRFFRETFEIE